MKPKLDHKLNFTVILKMIKVTKRIMGMKEIMVITSAHPVKKNDD